MNRKCIFENVHIKAECFHPEEVNVSSNSSLRRHADQSFMKTHTRPWYRRNPERLSNPRKQYLEVQASSYKQRRMHMEMMFLLEAEESQ